MKANQPKFYAVILTTLLLVGFHFFVSYQLSLSASDTPPMTGGEVATVTAAQLEAVFAQTPSVSPTVPTQVPSTPVPAETRPPAASSTVALTPEPSPALLRFIEQVTNGQAGMIQGVFVEDTLALPVIHQPPDDFTFVSSIMGVVTQFSSAADNGVIGLLAHNYLSGERFYHLNLGQEVWIVYGDGTLKRFRIDSVHQYQKLEPSSLHSDLIDLSTNEKVTTDEIFDRYYRGNLHLTFQTCLEKEGVSNWGLTFVIATPIPEN